MKKFLIFLCVLCVTTNGWAQTTRRRGRNAVPIPAPNVSAPFENNQSIQNLPIRRVILYSNGVAYIERRGIVNNRAEINLSFKQSQVDDVLKSMVVLDLGQGRIGAVSYNSSAPASARIGEIPFGINSQTENGTGGLAAVLSQLQGANVAVVADKKSANGAVLTVEKKAVVNAKSNDPSVTAYDYSLVIASENGEITSFDLSEVRSVKLLDEGTRQDVKSFAEATAAARRRDAKTITVTSEGAGAREMVVSYTIAAPIWKTTYRVVLDQAGKPFFQGWAIVDNVSEEDWSNVRLSLVSGTPISFIQPIQQPFYKHRPVVPISPDIKLEPQVYEPQGNGRYQVNGQRGSEENAFVLDGAADEKSKKRVAVTARQVNSLSAESNNQTMLLQNSMSAASNYSGTALTETTVSEALINNSGVETAAKGAEIGDLFEYRIEQPITVKRDRSALIPIVQTRMDGERVSIYNEAVRRDRPMSGMMLKNLTDLTFEGGSMTIIDRDAYAGEALMERLKPKEQRFISYALDLGTLVTVRDEENREPARLIKAYNGTFEVHYFNTERTTYSFTNQTERPRTIYVEYPVRNDWILTENTPKPDITTQKYYRFRVELAPFATEKLTIGEKQGLLDSYQIGELTRRDLDLFLSRRYIDDETRRKIEVIVNLRARISEIEAKYEALDDEKEKISEDQERLRDNIETLSKSPDAKTLIARYITKADAQESRLEAIETERKNLQTEKMRLETEISQAVRSFEISRTLN